jgi:hypothetical protein
VSEKIWKARRYVGKTQARREWSVQRSQSRPVLVALLADRGFGMDEKLHIHVAPRRFGFVAEGMSFSDGKSNAGHISHSRVKFEEP